LTAAGGQLLAVRRSAYDTAGGHAAVRAQVLEDIELARSVKRAGGRVAVADGSSLASCEMYTSWDALKLGYGKSLWASFGSPAGAAAALTLLAAMYLVPPIAAIVCGACFAFGSSAFDDGSARSGGAFGGSAFGSSAGAALAGAIGYLLAVAGRVVTARATGGRAWPDALAHPVSIALFGWLVIRSYAGRRSATWKGRPVGPRP
jgi:hypothetical protein